MPKLRVGSLCTGFGGLEKAVIDVLKNVELSFIADPGSALDADRWDSGPATLLAHRHPGVPNLGDISVVDWAIVEPVDILTAGFPCQDVSVAGRRKGLEGSTRSSVWFHVLNGIATLHPKLVVLENVSGLLSGGDQVVDAPTCCLFGGIDRRRGLYSGHGPRRRIRRMHSGRNVRQGRGLAPAPTARAWRISVPGSDAERTLGGSAYLDAQRPSGGVFHRTYRRILAVETGASANRAARRTDQGDTAPTAKRISLLDADSQRTMRSAEAQDRGAEQKGTANASLGYRRPNAVCPACGRSMARNAGKPYRRSWMGTVLGDLARIGFDAQWACLRASDVGAAHGRKRVFIIAWPADTASDTGRIIVRNLRAVPDADRIGQRPNLGFVRAGESDADRRGAGRDGVGLLPTPDATRRGAVNSGTATARRDNPDRTLNLQDAVALLPTPTASEGTGAGHSAQGGRNLRTEVSLLPTPKGSEHHDGWTLADVAYADRWGQYGAAIARWESVMGRPAPEPTSPSRTGSQQLSSAFVEWLMGCDAGWVTDVPGLTRNQQLRLLGNGVVWQQGAYALRRLLVAAGLTESPAAAA